MSKIRIALVLALVLLSTTPAFSLGSFKVFHYSDATFTTVVGATYQPSWDCPDEDLYWSWGTTSNFRKYWDYPECEEGGTPTVGCVVYNNGWTSVPCP